MAESLRPTPGSAPARGSLNAVLLYALLVAISLFFLLPLAMMVSTSLKAGTTDITDPGLIPREPSLGNFEALFAQVGGTPVLSWVLNSFLTAAIGTVVSVTLVSLSAYAFARMEFPGKRLIFATMIATLMLPGVLFLIPQVIVVNTLGLFNSIPAFFLPGLASVFGVFFMRQFFLGLPVELEEAAYVDGANRLQTFIRVILPVSGPALATLSVISFLAFWNDYLWPLVNCQGAGCTLQPGLQSFQDQNVTDYGLLMAGGLVAAIPVLIVFIVAQRWIVQAATSAGIKG
jgi:multiple sugar transport system permease protein